MNKAVYTWQKPIADYVRGRISKGATLQSTIESASAKFQQAPTNYRSFMRVYGNDVKEAKSDLEDFWLEKGAARADTSDKILELWLRSRAGLNPVDKLAVAEVDGDDLDEDSAVKSLMRMLGKSVDEDEDQ